MTWNAAIGQKTLAALLVAGATSAAAAQDASFLIGTFSGESRGVVSGSGGHYGERADTPQFAYIPSFLEWTDHDDGRLVGTITSAGHSETKIGVVSSDGVTLTTADHDGTSLGRILDEDSFELCYSQSSAGAEQFVVACVIYSRMAP